jgi:hypothetical protein
MMYRNKIGSFRLRLIFSFILLFIMGTAQARNVATTVVYNEQTGQLGIIYHDLHSNLPCEQEHLEKALDAIKQRRALEARQDIKRPLMVMAETYDEKGYNCFKIERDFAQSYYAICNPKESRYYSCDNYLPERSLKLSLPRSVREMLEKQGMLNVLNNDLKCLEGAVSKVKSPTFISQLHHYMPEIICLEAIRISFLDAATLFSLTNLLYATALEHPGFAWRYAKKLLDIAVSFDDLEKSIGAYAALIKSLEKNSAQCKEDFEKDEFGKFIATQKENLERSQKLLGAISNAFEEVIVPFYLPSRLHTTWKSQPLSDVCFEFFNGVNNLMYNKTKRAFTAEQRLEESERSVSTYIKDLNFLRTFFVRDIPLFIKFCHHKYLLQSLECAALDRILKNQEADFAFFAGFLHSDSFIKMLRCFGFDVIIDHHEGLLFDYSSGHISGLHITENQSSIPSRAQDFDYIFKTREELFEIARRRKPTYFPAEDFRESDHDSKKSMDLSV